MTETNRRRAWEGRVAAVTGASSGVGRVMAARLAAEGAYVVLLARRQDRLEAAAAAIGERACPLVADVSDAEQVRAAFGTIGERYGRLDVLMNVAGAARARRIEDLGDDDVTAMVGANLLGPIHTSRAAIPLLRVAGGGDILNVSSEITLDDLPLLSLYAATKHGLERFTRSMARELRADRIRVTLVVLGRTGGTDFADNFSPDDRRALRAAWEADGYSTRVAEAVPLAIDEVAEALLFAVSRPLEMALDVVHVRASGFATL